jgi:hypothetical protein
MLHVQSTALERLEFSDTFISGGAVGDLCRRKKEKLEPINTYFGKL